LLEHQEEEVVEEDKDKESYLFKTAANQKLKASKGSRKMSKNFLEALHVIKRSRKQSLLDSSRYKKSIKR